MDPDRFYGYAPFIGTGIMLLPLGVIYFFTGEYWKAIVASCCMDCAR